MSADNQTYKNIVKSDCDRFALLNPNATIYRTLIGRQFKNAGILVNNTTTIPGFLISEAMEEWAHEKNRVFKFEVGPKGKKINVRVE